VKLDYNDRRSGQERDRGETSPFSQS
jgi:hypothetical protein